MVVRIKHHTLSYQEYKDLVIHCAETNSSTGENCTPERIEATKLNAQRMKRIEKQFIPSDESKAVAAAIKNKYQWIVLAEAWCGDGAQIIPVLNNLAVLNSNIEMQIMLRDENPDVIDAYLTAGARSIPKLICRNENGEDVFVWGPRPVAITQMVIKYKSENPGISHDEFVKQLHTWYALDKGKSAETDIAALMKKLV